MSESTDCDPNREPKNEPAEGTIAGDIARRGGGSRDARQRLPWYKRAIFIAATFAMVLVILELSLNVLCLVSESVATLTATRQRYPAVADPLLGRKPNPEHPEHDASGFRNEIVPETAFVVALGDSQTYGTGVMRRQAWPQQLAQRSGISTYNMAFGGYGPLHSLALFDRAVTLKPRIIIEAFYAGNDLRDCFHMVYRKRQFVEMESADQQLLTEIRRLQWEKPLWHRTVDLGSMEFLASKYSRTYGLLWAVKRGTYNRLWSTHRRKALSSGARQLVFDVPPWRTIFKTLKRRAVLDLRDARIREGYRLALDAIRRMHDRATEAGIKFVVLLIPTKELVFSEVLQPGSEVLTDTYWSLVQTEREIMERTKVMLEREGIDFVDALPALQHCLEENRQPYPNSDDGHPNAIGQAAIADAVHSALGQLSILPRAIP